MKYWSNDTLVTSPSRNNPQPLKRHAPSSVYFLRSNVRKAALLYNAKTHLEQTIKSFSFTSSHPAHCLGFFSFHPSPLNAGLMSSFFPPCMTKLFTSSDKLTRFCAKRFAIFSTSEGRSDGTKFVELTSTIAGSEGLVVEVKRVDEAVREVRAMGSILYACSGVV